MNLSHFGLRAVRSLGLFSQCPPLSKCNGQRYASLQVQLYQKCSTASISTSTVSKNELNRSNDSEYNKLEQLLQSGQKERIEVGGFHVNYIKAGHGPNVVFCFPGALGSMRIQLQHQILNFDREKFTFIAWDQPGYGFSRPPERVITDDSLQEDADFAVHLMKMFGHDKFSVMGWSGGGCSSLLLAIRYPQVVKKLIVWGAFSYVDKKDAANFKWYGENEWGGRMRDVLVEEYGEKFFRRQFAIWMNLFVRIYTHRGGELCAKQLSKIKCPSLIIHGTEDKVVDPYHGQFLHDHLSNSRLHIWDGGKHNVQLRYPDEFNSLVQEYLLE